MSLDEEKAADVSQRGGRKEGRKSEGEGREGKGREGEGRVEVRATAASTRVSLGDEQGLRGKAFTFTSR